MDTPTMDTPTEAASTEAAPTEEDEPVHFSTDEDAVPGDVDRSGPIFVRARCSWCGEPTVVQQGDMTTMPIEDEGRVRQKREGDVVKLQAPCRGCGTDFVVTLHAPQFIDDNGLLEDVAAEGPAGKGALAAPEARA